jgi:hypothetical protein
MAKPKAPKPTPFDILGKPTDLQARNDLVAELCRDIEDAFNARASIIADGGLIDYADWYYEQGKSDPNDLPYPGAADLTSYLITQDVDALKARLVKAIFGVRPFCFAEGNGEDAKKAPYVQWFMDWQARKSDFKLEIGKTILGALIEDCYVLEVSEKVETRRLIEKVNVSVETDPASGGAIFENGKPKLKLDEFGEPIPPQPGEAFAETERTHTKTKRMGPQYDTISMKDFVFLPGHAKSRMHVWGYAYRFTKRVPEMKELVEDGVYDGDAVERVGTQSDGNDAQKTTAVDSVVQNDGDSAEKDLIQVCLKRDLDGDGREEWYIATLSLRYRELLRLKRDTFAQKYGRWRCVPFVLFPRRNSVYGYSYAFCKLLTIAEEHSVIRNTSADRRMLAANAPMTRTQTAIWDPEAQPIGSGRVIDVRQHDEVKMLDIRDLPASSVEAERAVLGANERVSGLADASVIGVTSEDRRTATEQKFIAGGSGVRVDEVVGYLHAAIAEVMALSHAIWIETLEAERGGLDAPASVVAGLQQTGMDLTGGKFTAEQLKGDFQFEPYGSDANSDPVRRQSMLQNKFVALNNIVKACPSLQPLLMSPDVGKALLNEWGRAFDVKDMQPFLGALVQQPMPAGLGGSALGPGPMGAEPAPPTIPPDLMALINGASAEGQTGGAY